jgi:hypothetical protein
MELNTGSSYNPTGDPLFHMPAWMRVTELIAGNTERIDEFLAPFKDHRGSFRAYTVLKIDEMGNVVEEYESARRAAAENDIPAQTMYNVIKAGKMRRGYFYKKAE